MSVAIDKDAIEKDEQRLIKDYVANYKIESLVQELVEGLLRDRPETKPKEHFAHLLRMQFLQEKQGADGTDGINESEMKEASKASEVPGRMLKALFKATRNITAEIVPKETINCIIQETIDLLNADRVSLFIYDRRIEMLVLNASNLKMPIRIKPGQGIAGSVFQTHETVNIPDCYADIRFDQSFDKATGYRTRNLITMPIVDFEGECMGVLQAINKNEELGDRFSHVDEILMENLTQHVSVALRNAEVYRAAIVTSERANALLHMIQSLSQDLGAQSMVLTITMHATELVQADRCTVWLVDEKKQQLWSVATDTGKEIKIPKSAGIAGECGTEGKLIVIPEAYEDPRFNQAVDKQTGYLTRSILAVPVLKRTGPKRTLAIIQMINKMEFDGQVGKFDDEDVQVMETFATFVASKLETSSLLCPDAEQKSEASNAFGERSGKDTSRKSQASSSRKSAVVSSFAEGDEDED